MKKKVFLKIICIFILTLVLCSGCNSSKNNSKQNDNFSSSNTTNKQEENKTENNEKTDKEDEKEKIFDINSYQNIKKIAESFAEALAKANIIPTNVTHTISKYATGMYKNTVYYISDTENITLKYSDNEELLGITLLGDYNGASLLYMNARIAISNFEYFNFSNQEKEIIKPLITGMDTSEKKIREWKIMSTAVDSKKLFRCFMIYK